MPESSVPHPGARPQEIEFPFAAAQAVVAAIDAELDDLAGCARDHEDGAGLALADAVGQSTNAFWQRLGSRLQDLAHRRAELEEQRSQVEALIGRARALEQSRRSEIAAWERRMRDHRDAP
jgi:Spy/CpxP family protein refolding chaperone